jgi:hypothetical protein
MTCILFKTNYTQILSIPLIPLPKTINQLSRSNSPYDAIFHPVKAFYGVYGFL